MQVPMMAAIGNKEKAGGVGGNSRAVQALREKRSSDRFPADPRTGHECGDSVISPSVLMPVSRCACRTEGSADRL